MNRYGSSILIALLVVGVTGFSPRAKYQAAEASLVIRRAQEAMGGKALAAVRSLEIVRNDGSEIVRLLLPDKYQLQNKASVFSFDGTRSWTRWAPGFPVPPPRTSTVKPEDRQRAGRYRAAVLALTYLLRSVPTYPTTATIVATQKFCADLTGHCVEFRNDSGTLALRVLIDGSTSRPIATVMPATDTTGKESWTQVEELRNYESFDGIMFPTKVVSRRLSDTGTWRTTAEWKHTYRVNPALTAADFIEKR